MLIFKRKSRLELFGEYSPGLVITTPCGETSPDGSLVSTGGCNLDVPGSNPSRAGYLLLWLCICSTPNCSKAWRVQCCLWYCAE